MYLDWSDFAALNRFVSDRYEEDPAPAKAWFSAPFDSGTGPQSALNVEMNLRAFAARNYSGHPEWRPEWAPKL